MIKACGSLGQWEISLGLIETMEWLVQEGGRRDSERIRPSIISVGSAIDACSRAGKWQEALDLLGAMKSTQDRLGYSSYNIFVNKQAILLSLSLLLLVIQSLPLFL